MVVTPGKACSWISFWSSAMSMPTEVGELLIHLDLDEESRLRDVDRESLL